MSRDSVAFAVSGVFFGLLVGWILGSQRADTPAATAPPSTAAAPAAAPAGNAAPAPPPLDETRASQLEQQARAQAGDAKSRIELGNMYFDSERFTDAIRWYEEAFKIDASNVDVSTDLAVAYYYTNQADRALAQIDRSLALNPGHLKTLLNQGIIRAFGKGDLTGAGESWQKVVGISPTSEEGRRAQQGLDGLRSSQGHGTPPGGAPQTGP